MMLKYTSGQIQRLLFVSAALLCSLRVSVSFRAGHSLSSGDVVRSAIGSRYPREHLPFSLASSTNTDESTAATQIYFDITISDTNIGRLVFHLTPSNHPNYLPMHISNFLSLVTSSRIGLDPKATYQRCNFQYSPSSVEDGSMRYRWGHVCDGPSVQIKEDAAGANQSLMKCKQSCFGGTFYGMSYQDVIQLIEQPSSDENDVEKEAVLLTVPTTLSTKFSIVRVSESPREWGERLLLNSAVIGYLDCESLDVLRMMARQRVGVPKITDCDEL